MNNIQLIKHLRDKIETQLIPLIDNNYYLLDLPYYSNIGDTLIWQGELDFLKSIEYKCLGMFSLDSFQYPTIDNNAIIIFQGGGNFGDLWPTCHEFRMNVVRHYPNNKFIFFPQTIWFKDQIKLKECLEELSYHNVHICVRDKKSFELLAGYFNGKKYLLPDMAFCIDISKFKTRAPHKPALFLKRNDVEFLSTSSLNDVIQGIPEYDVSDWPTMKQGNIPTFILYVLKKYLRRVPLLLDFYSLYLYRPYLIRAGVNLITMYDEIYTTRLHGAILSVLLGKRIVFFDNSYGKNSGFFQAWLKEYDKITFKN